MKEIELEAGEIVVMRGRHYVLTNRRLVCDNNSFADPNEIALRDIRKVGHSFGGGFWGGFPGASHRTVWISGRGSAFLTFYMRNKAEAEKFATTVHTTNSLLHGSIADRPEKT